MEISEVRIKLVNNSKERLRAFCSITLDGAFVVRDLKIIDGANGPFVAMPSRKLSDRCHRCGYKNHLRAKYCNECGAKLKENRAPKDTHGRAKLHADVAHPINSICREQIQSAVIEAFQTEMERAKAPDYKPQEYDEYDYDFEEEVSEKASSSSSQNKQTGSFSDYDELIADLKKDAAGRRKEDSRRFNRFSQFEEEEDEEDDSDMEPVDEQEQMEDESEKEPIGQYDHSSCEEQEEDTQESATNAEQKRSEIAQTSKPTDGNSEDDFGAGLL